MADSAVVITAGTGTNIDTRTEATNGNHRQVITIGDPSTNAGVAPVDATAGLKVDLGADNDVTVTGTVDLGATDNAVLDAIAADTGTIAGDTTSIDGKIPALGQALAAASVPVVLPAAQITTLTPPAAITGFATAAKQDTIIGHVDGVETLLGTIDADTSVLAATDFATEAKQDDIITAIGAIPGGGGVQYTEGDTDATITGTAALVEGAANALAVMTQPLTDTQLRASSVVVDLGANNDVTVTGTVDLGATDNAVLDSIAAKDFATQTTLAAINAKMVTGTDIGDVTINNASGAAAVNIQDGGNTITVDGTITAAQATAANLNMTEASAAAIKTAVETIDNAISGSEMQVDVVAALPAGTNAIGKLAANSGVDIGDVDVTSLPALVAGTAAIGKLLPPDIDVTAHTNYARKYYTNAGAVTDGIIWSPAAGKRWHVVTMYIQTSAAATITLEDDKAGGDDPVWKGELAANSGVTLSFTEKYPMASGEDAADLIITTSAGNVFVTVVGYEV